MKKQYKTLNQLLSDVTLSDDCFEDHKLKICEILCEHSIDVINHKYYKDIENEIYLNLKRFSTVIDFDDFDFLDEHNIFQCDNQLRGVGLFSPINEMCHRVRHRVRHKKIRKLTKKI